MINSRPRRQSMYEGDGSKIKRFNAIYPKSEIQQHKIWKEEKRKAKELRLLELQQTQKIKQQSSSNKNMHSLSSNRKWHSRNLNIDTSTKSRQSSRSNYQGVKQIFNQINFKTPKYSARNLIRMGSPSENKENIQQVYNLRNKRALSRLVDEELKRKSNKPSVNFMIRSNKSSSHCIKPAAFLFI